jgi:hypothetical protein
MLVALVAFWNWDWFIPVVSRVSAAIVRSVAISHLHVQPGRIPRVTVNGVTIANPPDWPTGDPEFVAIETTLTIEADAPTFRGTGLFCR